MKAIYKSNKLDNFHKFLNCILYLLKNCNTYSKIRYF